jgi:ribonuclease HI
VLINSTNPTNPKKIENLKSVVETKKGDPDMWTLFFDGSKYLEGAGVGCILKDMKGRKMLIACRLEFQCTNNTAEYEALLQGLRKEVDLKAEKIKVFGDSEIVIR